MLLPTKNIKLFVWGFRGVRQGLQVIGVGTEGYSARNLCLAMCCSMCICGNFFFFFFWNYVKVLAMLPLSLGEVAQKLQGTPHP